MTNPWDNFIITANVDLSDDIVSFQLPKLSEKESIDMAGETTQCSGCNPVDISPNVMNGILTASSQSFNAAMADGIRSGNFNMAALQSVALKNLDEVGAVESRATDKVMGT